MKASMPQGAELAAPKGGLTSRGPHHLLVWREEERQVCGTGWKRQGVTDHCLCLQSAHMAMVDALMMAYTVEMISIEKVVASVKRFSTFSASKELPYDLEDAMVFWINKVSAPEGWAPSSTLPVSYGGCRAGWGGLEPGEEGRDGMGQLAGRCRPVSNLSWYVPFVFLLSTCVH